MMVSKIIISASKPKDFHAEIHVAAIYLNVGNKLLMLQLAHHKSEAAAWGVPAGKINTNETPLQAARRELFEETGINILSDASFCSLGLLYIRKPELDYTYYLFSVRLDEKPDIRLSNEHQDYKWITGEEARKLNLMNGAQEALSFYYQQTSPVVIGISGISGAGKSTLAKKLAQTLNATALFWDDYDEISQSPEDYVKWFESGGDYEEWVYDELADTLKKLKEGHHVICPATNCELLPTKYIVFDAPLGYCHKSTGKYIDFLTLLDTPPDIALARRLLRDHHNHPTSQQILEELDYYLSHSRPLFLLNQQEKKCDLIVDGTLSIDDQEQKILSTLQTND